MFGWNDPEFDECPAGTVWSYDRVIVVCFTWEVDYLAHTVSAHLICELHQIPGRTGWVMGQCRGGTLPRPYGE